MDIKKKNLNLASNYQYHYGETTEQLYRIFPKLLYCIGEGSSKKLVKVGAQGCPQDPK
jgi:hypothetical protein